MKSTTKLYDIVEKLSLPYQIAAMHNIIGFIEEILSNHPELHIDPKHATQDISWGLHVPILDSQGVVFRISANSHSWTPTMCQVKVSAERIQAYQTASFPVEVENVSMNALNRSPGKLYKSWLIRFYEPFKVKAIEALEKVDSYKSDIEFGRDKIEMLINTVIWVPGMWESHKHYRGALAYNDAANRNKMVELHFAHKEVSVDIEAYPKADGTCCVKIQGDMDAVIAYLKAWTLEGEQSELMRADVEL